MKKTVGVLLMLAFGMYINAAELEVNQKEVQAAGDENSVQFENYGGPHAVIESAETISGIGRSLGLEIHENLESNFTARPDGKYTIIHAVDFSDSPLLDADILVLNSTAGVDHINNIRRILSGFLQSAYGYSKEDADVISVFVTVYNAVYRSNLQYFSERYKENVISNLHEQKIGLSTKWEEWAGFSEIVIPLNDVNGGLSSVDTTVISDDAVVEALRKEDDKALESREKLTEIKDAELKTASEKAKDFQKESAKQKAEGNKTEAAQSSKKSSEQQQLADRKTNEIRTEKEKIAADKESVASKASQAPVEGVTGLFVADAKKNLYTLQTLSAADGSVIKKSSLKQIRTKTVYAVSPELYLAICGVNDGHSAVRLCLIDSSTLEIKKQGNENLSETAELVFANGDFYTVVQSGKNYVLAVYDKNLTLKKTGSDFVSPDTPITVTAKGILVSGENERPLLLAASDLKKIW